jgi:general transcription factor 3C polypeptide 3 (transcription factor C subunit 4)
MNSQNGYYNQWPLGQPPNANGRRYVPIAGTFSGVPAPNLPSQQAHVNAQQYPIHFPHGQYIPPQQAFRHPQAAFTPLIPLSAVEDLQLPQIPFTSAAIPQTYSGAPFVTSGPVVHEGYIPAPGRNEEDVYPALPEGFSNSLFRDRDFESSDDESNYERELTFEEQMRQLEERDNSEIDKDYSEEDAQHDEGDPDEMELGVEFEDEEERAQRKPGKPVVKDSTTKATRGGQRGRPRARGRGGHSGAASTRGKGKSKGRGRGRPKGMRHGPRKVADPGEEFKELQRKANERFIAQDYSMALEHAQNAIQLNPEIFDAHNIASEIYAAMGEEVKSIDSLIIGAPTKRDPGLWHFIIERVNKLDPEVYPEYTEEAKTALTLRCLQQIVLLDNNNYEARSHILEIEASLGHVSKCVKLGRKMLKLRKENTKDGPDTEVLKIMAMMGTSNKRQTKLHLTKLVESFDDAIEFFLKKKPDDSDLDWEMINIYLDLLDRGHQYEYALLRLKCLARWKQGRIKETYWDDQEDDREYDIEDEPRRVAVPQFKRKAQNATFGQTLPLEIRVKLGIFRLRKGAEDFREAMVGIANFSKIHY